MRFGRIFITLCLPLGLGPIATGAGTVLAAEAKPAPIDWNRARELHAKEMRSAPLTADEQAYLDQAKAAHARGEGPNSAGAAANGRQPRPSADGIDWQRAQRLYQRSERGEQLSPEDQAYLDKAKNVRMQGGGSRPGAPPSRDHTDMIPLDQMTADEKYKGEDGGLYGGGKNVPPPAHAEAAWRAMAEIVPRDRSGKPAADGKIVLISIGMSNTTGEFSRFKQLSDADSSRAAAVVVVDCAQGGQDAARWSDASLPAWQMAMQRLRAAGVTPEQVQAVWMKHARIAPATHGEYPAHGNELRGHEVASLNIAKEKFSNLRIAYLSSRIYAGYAMTGLNPEPYAYESGLVVRRLIADQIRGEQALNYDPAKGVVKAPILLWGPYLWADGITPRKSDGMTWQRSELAEDGTHPSRGDGCIKVAKLLLTFFHTNPLAKPWYTAATK